MQSKHLCKACADRWDGGGDESKHEEPRPEDQVEIPGGMVVHVDVAVAKCCKTLNPYR